MSAGKDEYTRGNSASLMGSSAEGYESLLLAHYEWGAAGNWFSAGYAAGQAIRMAWGNPDQMNIAAGLAMDSYRWVLETEPVVSSVAIAALHQMRRFLWTADRETDEQRRSIQAQLVEIDLELANRLEVHSSFGAPADSFLVRGLTVTTDLDGAWSLDFPKFEAADGYESGGDQVVMEIPSAFTIYVRNKDWSSAARICTDQRTEAFASPGLRGWREVAIGHSRPPELAQHFLVAAAHFESDVAPPTYAALMERGGAWSGVNCHLWARYFRSRAHLLDALSQPERSRELVRDAASAWGEGPVQFASPDAMRLAAVVRALSSFLNSPDDPAVETVIEDYKFAIRATGQLDEDSYALDFLTSAAGAFKGFATNPDTEATSGRLSRALESLARVPVIGPSGAEALRPALGASAMGLRDGFIRTWMHRRLVALPNEAALHLVLLRLLQAGIPKYAQIRHGPIEYGKDISVLLDDQGSLVLRHYQVKSGSINKRTWHEAQVELEEAIHVPLASRNLPADPQVTEVVLVTNGHISPHADPVAKAWFDRQKGLGNRVKLMQLDGLVEWIAEHQLANELRLVLDEVATRFPNGASPKRSRRKRHRAG